jgi:hypothetical protein
MFTCLKCNKEFTRKFNLDVHLKNKSDCAKKLSRKIEGKYIYTCDKCPKTFTRNIYLENHIKKYHSDQSDHSILELENIKLKETMEEMKATGTVNNINALTIQDNVLNNTVNIIQNNNIELNVKPFAYENDDYIEEAIMKKCIEKPYLGVVLLTKLINFNEAHPENFNMYMNNKKKQQFSFWNSQKWVLIDKLSALHNIFNVQTDRIGFFLDAANNISDDQKEEVEEILSDIKNINDHEYKMLNNVKYRTFIKNMNDVFENNSDLVKKAVKDKSIKINNETINLKYDNPKFTKDVMIPHYISEDTNKPNSISPKYIKCI